MIRKLKIFVRNQIWKFLKLSYVLPSGIKLVIKNDSDWVIYNEIFVNNEYDAVFKKLEKENNEIIIFDLGANVGYFSLKAADFLLNSKINNFKIIAIEGDIENYQEFLKRVNQKIVFEKIKIIHGLVGKTSGSAILEKDSYHFGYKVNHQINNQTHKSKHLINYVDLNQFVTANNSITIIKCDIEGSENIFIKEYEHLLRKTNLFICEFHYKEDEVSALDVKLKEYGFENFKLLRSDKRYDINVKLYWK